MAAQVRAPHSQLMKDGVLCGNPERSFSLNPGEYVKAGHCDDCARLKNIKRNCLKCGDEFRPGCAARWTCRKCYGKGEA